MKTVLQCDFCSETLPLGEKGDMVLHEKGCSFSPANRKCYSCKHADHFPYDTDPSGKCNAGQQSILWDVKDGHIECPAWEIWEG